MKSLIELIRKQYRLSGMIAKIYAAVLLAAFLPFVIIFILLWRYCSGVFSESIRQSAAESFQSRQHQVQMFEDEIIQTGKLLGSDEQMHEFLHRGGNLSFLSYQINQRIRALIPICPSGLEGLYVLTGTMQEFLVLFDEAGTHLSLRGDGADRYVYLRDTAASCTSAQKSQTGFFTLREVPCVAIGLPEKMILAEDETETEAVIVFLFEQKKLADFTRQASEAELPWAFRIHNETGLICEDPSFAGLEDGGELLNGALDGFGWEFSCMVNTTRVRANAMKRFGAVFLGVLAAYILLVVLITIMINRQLHSLEVLRERMIQIGEGGSYKQIDLSGDRDVAYLFSGYNEMVRKVKQQENIILDQNRKNLEIAEKQRIAELKALELEINPHYLYNTLNTINSVAIEHGDYQVSRLLKGYSSTLVYMLRDRFQPVTIRQEVDWLREYLLLQQERFPGVFTCEIDAEPELLDEQIYKLLLQPFVENTIIHGFEGRTEGGFLSILLYVDDPHIVISIWDNGKGIEPEELERIRQIAARPMETESERIGILNSCRRLYGYYGDAYRFTIDSDVGKGTRVELRLPFMSSEKEDGDASEET